jgi:crotonobetainyl-CoA:carnitine CoA-transferase CaiB-like acyl-CoA transferase
VPRQYDPTAVGEVAALLVERPRADWLELLGDDACVAPVNAPRDAERDPQVLARGLVVGEGMAAHVRSPLRVAAGASGPGGAITGAGCGEPADAVPELPAPGLGDHTREILEGAGIGAAELDVLQRDGIVAGPATPEAMARAARLASVLARLAERGRGDAIT